MANESVKETSQEALAAFVDYSHEVKPIRNPYIRRLLQAFAALFLGLGIVGIFLPLLPTTPFILLSAACYARSSVKFYNWLMNHRRLGPPLRQWRQKKSISRKNKIISVSMMLATFVPTIIWWTPFVPAKFILAAIGLSVATFVITRSEEQ